MTLACSLCGSRDVLAVSPGVAAPLVLDFFVLQREQQMLAWCSACWPLGQKVTGETIDGEKTQRSRHRARARSAAARSAA